jgi:hypothetical protein
MSAFSFTAPFVSTDDERRELEGLNEKERRSIHRDVYGTEGMIALDQSLRSLDLRETIGTEHDDIVERKNDTSATSLSVDDIVDNSQKFQAQALTSLHDALQIVRRDTSTAYAQACELCPDLIEKESNPLFFLQCEKYDATAAADRLVRYWNLRRELFGLDKAYFPMTLDGAMKDDLIYLQQGFIFEAPHDMHHRPVVYFDRIRSSKKIAPRDAVNRCIYYVLQKVTRHGGATSSGYVLLLNLRVSQVDL